MNIITQGLRGRHCQNLGRIRLLEHRSDKTSFGLTSKRSAWCKEVNLFIQYLQGETEISICLLPKKSLEVIRCVSIVVRLNI